MPSGEARPRTRPPCSSGVVRFLRLGLAASSCTDHEDPGQKSHVRPLFLCTGLTRRHNQFPWVRSHVHSAAEPSLADRDILSPERAPCRCTSPWELSPSKTSGWSSSDCGPTPRLRLAPERLQDPGHPCSGRPAMPRRIVTDRAVLHRPRQHRDHDRPRACRLQRLCRSRERRARGHHVIDQQHLAPGQCRL